MTGAESKVALPFATCAMPRESKGQPVNSIDRDTPKRPPWTVLRVSSPVASTLHGDGPPLSNPVQESAWYWQCLSYCQIYRQHLDHSKRIRWLYSTIGKICSRSIRMPYTQQRELQTRASVPQKEPGKKCTFQVLSKGDNIWPKSCHTVITIPFPRPLNSCIST